MRDPKTYYVYILTNPSQHPFYTGVTNNMYRRMRSTWIFSTTVIPRDIT